MYDNEISFIREGRPSRFIADLKIAMEKLEELKWVSTWDIVVREELSHAS